MSKPKLSEVTYAVYVLGVNLNGQCVYCGKNMSGMPPDYKAWHYEQEHEATDPQKTSKSSGERKVLRKLAKPVEGSNK